MNCLRFLIEIYIMHFHTVSWYPIFVLVQFDDVLIAITISEKQCALSYWYLINCCDSSRLWMNDNVYSSTINSYDNSNLSLIDSFDKLKMIGVPIVGNNFTIKGMWQFSMFSFVMSLSRLGAMHNLDSDVSTFCYLCIHFDGFRIVFSIFKINIGRYIMSGFIMISLMFLRGSR